MNSKKDNAKKLLEGAYALKTPNDHVQYYKDFAESYDQGFADVFGYAVPQFLTKIYHEKSTLEDVPILDVGCGTGLVAEALTNSSFDIDGVDISEDMLRKSAAKGIYRQLFELDLTRDIDKLPTDYGALLSAGTFTHQHLGPDVLRLLLNVVKKGGLFCVGVNGEFFHQSDFGTAINQMKNQGLITAPELLESHMYEKSGHAHENDRVNVLVFRRL